MAAASWVGVSGGATTGKKMAAAVVVTLISLACACAVLGVISGLRRGGVRGRERGTAALAYDAGPNCSFFCKGKQSKPNAAEKFEKFQTTILFASLVPFIPPANLAQPPLCGATALSAVILLTDSLESCAAIVHTVAVPFILLVWASATAQSNSCQHPLPELLFSLITIMSGGMGRAGGGLSTHTQPKHRDWKTNFTLHSSFYSNAVVSVYFFPQSCQSLAAFSQPVPFNQS